MTFDIPFLSRQFTFIRPAWLVLLLFRTSWQTRLKGRKTSVSDRRGALIRGNRPPVLMAAKGLSHA